jgi:hypothetical protein
MSAKLTPQTFDSETNLARASSRKLFSGRCGNRPQPALNAQSYFCRASNSAQGGLQTSYKQRPLN